MNKNLAKIIDSIKQKRFYNIGFLGDSITSTEWVHPNWREIVRYVLEDEIVKSGIEWQLPSWYIKTINAGFNGATTKNMLNLLDKGLLDHKPDLVIFTNTLNDMDLGLTPEEHALNTVSILEILIKKVSRVVVCTSNASLSENYNSKYAKYIVNMISRVSENKAQFVDLFKLTSVVDKSDMFTFISVDGNPDMGIDPGSIDFGHPNSLGNAYIAKILLLEIFGIEFDHVRYTADSKNDVMYPKY